MTALDHEEILDLVNEKDIVTGTVPSSKKSQKGNIIRLVGVHIINERDELLVGIKHKRVHTRIWTIVGSGHVSAGETPEDAAIREVWEEAELDASKLEFVKKLFIHDHIHKSFVYVYRLEVKSSDVVFPKDNLEFAEYMWLKIQDPTTCKYELTKTATNAMNLLTGKV